MSEDLRLFNELIKEEAPDVEINETLFAYYCNPFQLTITKVSEVQTGLKTVSMYELKVSGELTATRYINNKENALIKAHLLINDFFNGDAETYNEDETEFITRTYFSSEGYND
ncbi:MAG: hypothetical protein ACRYGG_00850 [Janthinobacterium lividum]